MNDSAEISARLQQADDLRRSGRHRQARVLLEGALGEYPEHAELHFRLAQLDANAGRLADCRARLERAHRLAPAQTDYARRLGDVCARLGDAAAARAAYRAVLQTDRRNVPALLRLFELALQAGDTAGAVDACQRVVLIQGPVAGALRDPRLPAPLRRTLVKVRRTLKDKYQELLAETLDYLADRYPAAQCRRITAALRGIGDPGTGGGHPLQKPEFLAFPDLPPAPWFERDAFAWTADVETHWRKIRAEFLALDRADPAFHPYIYATAGEARTLQGTDFSTLAGNRDWSAFHLNRAGWIAANCARCPRTAELMQALPLAEAVGYMPEVFYSVLSPGTEIVPHYGQTNVRLTVHLGLIVPPRCGIRVAGETRHWEEGKLLAFDDSFEHAAWNRDQTDRVVLISEAWHPDLQPAEIDGLQHFFATRSAWLAQFDDIAPQGGSHA